MHATDRRLVATGISFSSLREAPPERQQADGYALTLAEIWQQPQVWVETAHRMLGMRERWQDLVTGAQGILLTGSGSSYFLGKCIASALQKSLSLPVTTVESGDILMLSSEALPAVRPLLVVSFARSGDSPESWGGVQHLLDQEPDVRHLIICCNPEGRLARTWGEKDRQADPRVRVLLLDERSCDRSLVMTSSFTSMAIAGLGLTARAPEEYLRNVALLADSVSELLSGRLTQLETFPWKNVESLIAVGSGALHGAVSEVALKMLEMTDGRVMTRAEGCLGLRHGPMCALSSRSMLFLPLSAQPLRRAYQIDLLKEVNRKQLGGWNAVVGSNIPFRELRADDIVLDLPALKGLGDEWLALASVVVGQLMAFLRCRAEGLRPDEPVLNDSITRVVGGFTLHR